MNINFPINYKIIENYPSIRSYFTKDLKNKFSQKQIFRLLDNVENYKHIKNLVAFLEGLLSNEEFKEFVFKKIRTKDYLTFSNNLKELFLLDYLLINKFKVIPFDIKKGKESVPEFYVEKLSDKLLIELYSPIELYGFEIFLRELQTSIKYFHKELGFNCSLEIKTKANEWSHRNYLPYELYYIYKNDKYRRNIIERIVEDIFSCFNKGTLKKEYLLTANVYINTEIKFNNNYNNRFISISTPSYDSVISYMNLNKQSKGFYQKLLKKIKYGQFKSEKYSTALKTLFVDFSHSMGSEVLVEGLEEDFLSKTFYSNIRENLNKDILPKDVDLIYPVLCNFNNNFFIGNCIYNSQNIKSIFNAN